MTAATVFDPALLRGRFPRTCGGGLAIRTGVKGTLSRVLRYPTAPAAGTRAASAARISFCEGGRNRSAAFGVVWTGIGRSHRSKAL
jgi:hypothetical protein